MKPLIVCVSLLIVANLSDAKCPSFFEEFNKACYHYGNSPINSVQQALESCYSLGGYLLNIDAELEYRHTIDRIKAQYNIYDGYWIGGVYKKGNWLLEKIKMGVKVHTVMDPDSKHYYWGPNEPGSNYQLHEHYAAIMAKGRQKPYHLYSENGNLQTLNGMSYICEANWKD